MDDMQEADQHKGTVSLVLYHILSMNHLELREPQKHFEVCFALNLIRMLSVCTHLFAFMHVCACHPGNVLGCYKAHFSLEIICEPAAPIKVIDVQCAAQVSSANTLGLLSGYSLTFRAAEHKHHLFFSVQGSIY